MKILLYGVFHLKSDKAYPHKPPKELAATSYGALKIHNMNKLLSAATRYLQHNISIIAVDENKRAIVPWKKFQSALATDTEITEQFSSHKAHGIAIICGEISARLEVVDLDIKYDQTGNLYNDFTGMIRETNHALLDKLAISQTKNNGFHFYYRCEIIGGNTKLAQRPATEQETKENPNERVKVLIETRGESGYVVAPPTDGYKFLSKKEIPVITTEEREQIFEIARSFNTYFQEEQKKHYPSTEKFSTSPFDDFNLRGDAEQMLVNRGWQYKYEKGENRYYLRPGKNIGVSASFHTIKRWFTVFSTSTEFDALKAYSPVDIFTRLECGGDLSCAAKRLLDLGYGERRKNYPSRIEQRVFKKKQEGTSNEDIIKFLTENENINIDTAKETVEQLDKQWGPKICTFWDVDEKRKITISRQKMEQFLSLTGGFYLYFYDKNSTIYRIVRIHEGFVEESSSEQMKKFVKDYILSLPDNFDNGISPSDLMEIIYKGADTYFGKGFLEFLPRIDINFLRDTQDESFLPLKNGVVRITKDDIELLPYSKVKGSVWKSRIIDFKIDIDSVIDWQSVEFVKFLEKISDEKLDRIEYILSIIGYVLHGYKNPTKPFAPIFGEETDDDKKGGGTGKGIIIKAIGKLIPTVIIDGKNFDPRKPFAWQRVGFDTRFVVIDDAPKNFIFEAFYSCITEGMAIEKKNKDELYIPYEDSPKIGVTTNYSVPNIGNHAKRRQKLIENGSFFHPGNTPEDHFGHRLFDDWDTDEWNRFYNMMFQCVKIYLKEGIKDNTNSVTIRKKQIKLNYGEEFLEWFGRYSTNGCSDWHWFSDMYNEFLNDNEYDKKDYSKKRFKKALEDTCGLFDFEYTDHVNRQEKNKKQVKVMIKGVNPLLDEKAEVKTEVVLDF